MTKINDLQDKFLNDLCDNQTFVSIYLVNGIKLQGKVIQFDSFALTLMQNNAIQLIYKHAISTIVPGASNHHDTIRNTSI